MRVQSWWSGFFQSRLLQERRKPRALPPPLRRQGRAGEGCPWDRREPWPPPPSLPLPSQGEGPRRELAAEARATRAKPGLRRSEEHTSELQSLMRISYSVFCLKKKKKPKTDKTKDIVTS